MKNILITGATSFIGKHLIKKLVKLGGYKITALVRDGSNLDVIAGERNEIKIHYYDSDYASIESLFQATAFDSVYHLAALSNYDYDSSEISAMIDSSIKLGTFILEAMKKFNCRYFINSSTYWQHYQNQDYQPICLYAATKKAFEDIIEFYSMEGSIKAISLKLYDVYGYDDHRNKLLNCLIKQNENQVFNLTSGEQKLYLVFIDDVINAYIEAKELVQKTQNHKVYGVYGEEKFSLKEIVAELEKQIGKKLKINWGEKDYHKLQIMDPYAENRLENWEAKVSLQKGIQIILKENYDK
jgi:nucleoside-diphosphate-sugar epimerase